MTGQESTDRELTTQERLLVRWMLERGEPDAAQFIPQLDRIKVLPTRCPCGCASIDFIIDGQPKPTGALRPIADFVFGSQTDLSGILVFEKQGILAGLEVYGLAGDAPKTLPRTGALRPFPEGVESAGISL